MNLFKKLILVFFLVNVIKIQNTLSLTGVNNNEYRLYNDIFQNYSKSVRPTRKWSDLLNVELKLNLKKIASVFENHQTVTIYVKLEVNWVDQNLVWDPKNYDNLQSIVLSANKVWVPDLHLFNSASEDDRIYPTNIEVFSNGNVRSFPINQLYAHCDFDFSRFPYDSQECDFMIGSMTDRSKVNVTLNVNATESKIIPNLEWKFVRLDVHPTWSLNVPGTQDNKQLINADWSVTKFTLIMKRSPTFYVNLFIWPIVFILFLAMSIFILPPNCVERVTMGSLLILTLVIMSLMLDSYTPDRKSVV